MKCLSLRGLLFVLFLFCSSSIWAESFNTENEGVTIYYNITSEENAESPTVEVTYEGTSIMSAAYSGDVVIPGTVTYNETTYTVTAIGDHAFYDCTSLTSITIPKSVTSIGDNAFQLCSGLTTVTISEDSELVTIGLNAFRSCRALTSITIPDGVTEIGSHAFYQCTALTSVEFPSNLVTIDEYAFFGCTGLTSITIPGTVTSIGDYAFDGCTNLTEIYCSTLCRVLA